MDLDDGIPSEYKLIVVSIETFDPAHGFVKRIKMLLYVEYADAVALKADRSKGFSCAFIVVKNQPRVDVTKLRSVALRMG